MRIYAGLLATLPLLWPAGPAAAQTGAPVIWEDRGAASALDVVAGVGGAGHEPGMEFTFIKESSNGTSPKFDVEDEFGVRWKVKLGEEARSETAATRLLWAAGYLVDEDYYRPSIHVSGLPPLARGQAFVTPDGTVAGARLERDLGDDGTETWSWYDNPFLGTREFSGLKVMMALINNWDLKAVNNGASTLPGAPQRHYRVADLGATFGRTGNSLHRSKGVRADYASAPFIARVTPEYVDLVMHSRPFFLSMMNVANYRFRTRMEGLATHIPIAEAQWIGDRLGQLSRAQVRDAFTSGGFPGADAEAYADAVMTRVAALRDLTRAAATTTTPRPWPLPCPIATCRPAPLRERLNVFGAGTPHLKAVFGGFEQGSGISGGVRLTSAQSVRAVELSATALTSTKRFGRVDVEASVPRLFSGRLHADAWFSGTTRDTDFFGVGPRTVRENRTEFAITRRSYQGVVAADVVGRLQVGAYTQVTDTHTSPGSYTADAAAPAPPGGANVWANGLFATYDARDTRVGLTRGVNLYGRVAVADGLGGHGRSPRDGWSEKEFDIKGYLPLGNARTSLLLRTRGQWKTPLSGSRPIPFYELSWLGGREALRGYDGYRFRGDNLLLLSSEVQRTLHAWTGVRGVDVFTFGDTGRVWSGGPPDRVWHSGAGGGVQYRHSPSLSVRVEVARSHEHVATYWSLSRGL